MMFVYVMFVYVMFVYVMFVYVMFVYVMFVYVMFVYVMFVYVMFVYAESRASVKSARENSETVLCPASTVQWLLNDLSGWKARPL